MTPADDPRLDGLDDRPSPIRLYRNTQRGQLFGVCAGLADYFGMGDGLVRVLAVLFLVVFPPQTLLIYLIAAAVMKKRPPDLFRNPEEERFWRSVAGRPDRTFHTLQHKFRTLEERLAGLERHVTSREYALDREFRDLEK